tara:strand:- start:3230 stop:3889 length:660 start_codon:yes stop_codon:yes gene_type:complete
MSKRLIIALTLLLLFSTYNIRDDTEFSSILQIKEITIENNRIISEKEIKSKLSYLYGNNLFFIDNKLLESKLREIDFLESFEVKKVYPNLIKLKIEEKKPIAILHNKKEKKYYTHGGDLINFLDLKTFENLPVVFGDKKSFNDFYDTLENINFPIKEIKTFYLFESKRWDILTNKNQLIKLPIKNYEESLKNFISLKDQKNFENYKTFDYRIFDQLILK